MRIGLLTTSYPRFDGDPSGLFVSDFVRAIEMRGHDVHVLAPEDSHGRGPLRGEGVRYAPRSWQRTFYGAGAPDNLRRPLAWPGLGSFPWLLARAAARHAADWDAIVSHFGLPCAFAAKFAAPDLPHLAVWHSSDVALTTRIPGLRGLARTTASLHWCVTRDAKERLGFDDAWVMPMSARVRAHPREIVRRTLGVTGTCALFVGRLVHLKGVDRAIDAIDGLPMELIIAGDGPEFANLRRRAQQRNAPVRFLGAIGRAERDRWLGVADAFVLPSRKKRSVIFGERAEGAPVAVLEAQLAGLPVIASRTGGLEERVRHGVDGWLVDEGERSGWSNAFRRLCCGEFSSMGEVARVSAQEYRFERFGPHIEEALRTAGVRDSLFGSTCEKRTRHERQ